MPDESTASTEHALLQEITAPLATLPDDALPDVANVDFPVAMRGYDRLAVDAYVKRTTQLVAELQSTRSPEAAVRRGLERVGEEVAGILQRAHEAASQITAQSRSDAEDRLERARQEATQITADAERRLRDLDAETDRIWAERQRIVDDAQQLAQQLLALASSAAERFPAAEDPETTQGDSRSRASSVVGPASAEDEAGLELEEPTVDTVEKRDTLERDPVFDAESEADRFEGEPGAAALEGEPDAEADRFADDVESTRVMPPLAPPDEDPTV
jgi:cell division initiation protein